MSCMKCGRDTPAEQVFCENCLLEMEKYPVRPGTVVQLPHRRDTAPKKTTKRRGLSLEEQVKILKRRVMVLTALLAVLLCLLGVTGYYAYDHFSHDHFKVGQNYTSVPNTQNESADTLKP